MHRVPWTTLLRIFALIAIAVSGALVYDYAASVPSFCGGGSGCTAVRNSGYAFIPLGSTRVPLPIVGLLGFGALFALSLLERGSPARKVWVPLGAYLAGTTGLGLFLLQAITIKTFCSLCVVVDLCAVGAAVTAFFEARTPAEAPRLAIWAWIVLGGIAVVAARGYLSLAPRPELPAGVAALYQPDKINIVEYADFECPHCRDLHPRLKTLAAQYGDRVNFVRRHAPLPMHPRADGAARAVYCAEAQGKGELLADRVMKSDDLSLAALRRDALEIGIDASRYDACVAAPTTRQAIDEQFAVLKRSDFRGLPTTFIGDTRLLGAVSDEELRASLERAAQPGDPLALGLPSYGSIVLAVAGLVVFFGRRRDASTPRTDRVAPGGARP